MNREPKRERTIRVKWMYEPDRMGPTHLQVAYEKVVPPEHYRLMIPEQSSERLETDLHPVEEVAVWPS